MARDEAESESEWTDSRGSVPQEEAAKEKTPASLFARRGPVNRAGHVCSEENFAGEKPRRLTAPAFIHDVS